MQRQVQHLHLTGVIFFDKVHGQIGGAPNGIELHPVLKVEALRAPGKKQAPGSENEYERNDQTHGAYASRIRGPPAVPSSNGGASTTRVIDCPFRSKVGPWPSASARGRTDRLTIYRVLLEKGYFPRELPPSFFTEHFAQYAATKTGRAKLATHTLALGYTHCVEYDLGKPGGVRRTLSIPNPISFTSLAALTAKHFKRLLTKAGKSKCARSRPVYDPKGARRLQTLYKPTNLARERAIIRTGARYLLRLDISQFYPSLYTHAVGWAIDPKYREKKHWHDKKLLAYRIDERVRNCQGRISQGIPIGHDVSFLLSEIVLCQVDHALRLKKQNAFRWVDDYEIACGSIEEAEAWLASFQREFSRFRLRVNPQKMSILPLPQAASDGWQSTLRDAVKRQLERPAELLAYFDQAFRLRAEHPEVAVMNYALGLLFRLAALTDHAAEIAQSSISQAMLCEPGCVQKALAVLTFWSLNGMPLKKDLLAHTISQIVTQQRQRGLSSDVAWGLFFCLEQKLSLEKKAVAALEECEDNCIALLALHMRAQKLLPAKFRVRALTQSIKSSDLESNDWLLLYEGERLGFIKPSPPAAKHPGFADMMAKKVAFYRDTLPPYASVIHPGGAPEWVVQKWVTHPVEKKGKGAPKKGAKVPKPTPIVAMISKDVAKVAPETSPDDKVIKLLDAWLQETIPEGADEEGDLSP